MSNSVAIVEPPIVVFDGSFEGWLTAVFAVYENHWQHAQIISIIAEHDFLPNLWQTTFVVKSDVDKAKRVSHKLKSVFGNNGFRQLLWAFLSEQPTVYGHLFGVVRYQLACPDVNVWQDYTHTDVMPVLKLIKMVGRERHRMQAFVRFEHMEQDVYFARVEPDFNVLPLLSNHFKNRYADQSWAIFDVKRGYGIFYDKDDPNAEVQLITDVDENALVRPHDFHSEYEKKYQHLWQKYFTHVTIKERKNPKLHIQYLPRRYWKYLTEKNLF
ncbi:TIGR03915 family putative DNA repair protein [Moraxella nasovis]|uniref:TIGR03915 family putative DNA repair protein n=1 Tax=Moraxella nasovis TaxID=2904121 RepID=UPI001F618BD7|nr:TIGR03915 family putative DNA repair protein [Moraxella nasovis]UNU73510.1 TIGR03915 family putative DNA repair protein [Moraxella nasovis]